MQNISDVILGGVEKYLFDVKNELEKRGHSLVMLYTNSGRKDCRERGSYYLPILGLRGNREFFYHLRTGGLFRELRTLSEILAQEAPDIIHLHNFYSPILLRMARIPYPIVHTIHDFFYLCGNELRMRFPEQSICDRPLGWGCIEKRCFRPSEYPLYISRLLNRRCVMGSDRVIVTTDYVKKVLLKNKFSPFKVEVIPYFTELPDNNVSLKGSNIILYVGALVGHKGVEFLLRALEFVEEDYQVVIVGDGDDAQRLKEITRDTGLEGKVRFVGWQSSETISQFYRQARVVVVPSIWPEPFGMVGIEAMAHARPVVAFNVGGIPEWLIDGETGFLVTVKDYRSLAKKISLLLKDPDLATGLGRRGREVVREKFNKTLHIERLLAMYQKVITEGR